MCHKERAVSTKCVHLKLRLGKLCAERAVYFITHIGIAVFHMISAALFRSEKSLHIARKRTCGGNGNIILSHKLVDDSERERLIQSAGKFC